MQGTIVIIDWNSEGKNTVPWNIIYMDENVMALK